MLSNILFGCIIFLTTNISLLYASHLLNRKFFPDAPLSVRLSATALFFYSFIILIFQVLSPFYAINKVWVTVSCILVALASHFTLGDKSNIKFEVASIIEWIRDGLNSRWAALIIVCGFVILLSFSCALLMPPVGYDALVYHLTFAALWIKKGTLLLFKAPGHIMQVVHFPINGEIFASWLLLPFHNDLLVGAMNFPIMLIGCVSIYAIGREFGLSRKEACWAPALLCFTPMLYTQIIIATVDIAVLAFCSTAVLFTIRYIKTGCLNDGVLSLISAGIVLGIKYTMVPTAGFIFIAVTVKTLSSTAFTNKLKKPGFIFLGLIIICVFGGRQYIYNCITAKNPLYPFHVKIFNHVIFTGSQFEERLTHEVENHYNRIKWDKSFFLALRREYKKFCYLPLSAGPKFLALLILAFFSIFTRPRKSNRAAWYFMSVMWILPIFLFFVGNPTSVGNKGKFATLATRYLAPSIAFFTIQALVFVKRFSRYLRGLDFFFVALIAWDILFVYNFLTTHINKIAALYPLAVILGVIFLVLINLSADRLRRIAEKKGGLSVEHGSPRLSANIFRLCTLCVFSFFILVGGLYIIQNHREAYRYLYYNKNITGAAKKLINGWKFLDHPDEPKTIALAMERQLWFFYPLLGSCLQNDIAYISARYKGDVPTWYSRGVLSGTDFSIWFSNLKAKNVDYVIVVKPWPIELTWLEQHNDIFEPVLSEKNFKIFKYNKNLIK